MRTATALAILLASTTCLSAAEPLRWQKLALTHPGEVYHVEFSADGQVGLTVSVAGTGDGPKRPTVLAWDVASGRVLAEGDDDAEPVVSVIDGIAVRFQPGETAGSRIVTDLVSGERYAKLDEHESISALVRSSAGTSVITTIGRPSGSSDDAASRELVVRQHTGSTVRSVRMATTDPVKAVHLEISPDGRIAAYAEQDAVLLMDLNDGKVRRIAVEREAKAEGEPAPPTIGFSADSSRLYVLTANTRLTTYAMRDLSPGNSLSIAGFEEAPRWAHITESPDGSAIVFEGTRATGIADLVTGKQTWAARGSSINRYRMDVFGGSNVLIAHRSRSNPTSWHVLEHVGGEFKVRRKVSEKVALGSLAVSPNGACVPLFRGTTLTVVEPFTAKVVGSAQGLQADLYRGQFTPDGRLFVVGDLSGGLVKIEMPKACYGSANAQRP